MPCYKPFNKGFSLIEFLIITVILIILISVSFVIFKQLEPKIQLNGTTRELITDLRYAQQLTVSEQVRHGIRFSATAPEMLDEYRLIRYGEETQEIFIKKLPEGIKFQAITGFTNQEVLFNPYGAVQETGEIVLVNTQNNVATINIRPSGFVKKIN